MDTQYALSFLKANQPMPNDKDLSSDLINEYDCVRKFFLANPCEKSIPLFLNSFGEISGHGVYQLVEDVIRKFDKHIVLPYLKEALKSNVRSIRYWCAQIAAEYPDETLIPQLKEGIFDSDDDIKMASLIALSQIESSEARKLLLVAYERENDDGAIDLLKDILFSSSV